MTDQKFESDEIDGIETAQVLSSFLNAGGTFSSAFSENACIEDEAMYSVAHSVYEQGRYKDAFKIFSLLVMRNHLEPRYLSGLGGSCQMLGRYVDALMHYMAAAVADTEDPKPIYHAAECLIALSRRDEARDSLKLVLEMCPERTAPLNRHALALLQRL